jgi:hypothetical protein
MTTLDFFARRAHYIDHLAPVWNALPPARRGRFHIAQELETYARQELQEPCFEFFRGGIPPGNNPILTAAYGDLNKVVRNPNRKIITMEHGVTQGFGTAAYPSAQIGNRSRVDLALLPNEYVAGRFRAIRETPCEVIGTPKMDRWYNWKFFSPDWTEETQHTLFPHGNPPTLAIAFHWGDRQSNPPESGSAFEHYSSILTELAAQYHVIGHAHPLASPTHKQYFERAGFEWVEDFREVLRRADVYLNDLSSTMYEFLVTGKPVVILNAPWFRRSVHWGIRFWDYSDVGVVVDRPEDLFPAIDGTISGYESIFVDARRRAVNDLYPYAGTSAQRAVEVLERWLDG